MKNDIDFDELDKAVGAVLGSQPSDKSAVSGPVSVADDKPVEAKADAKPAEPAKPAKTVPAAAKAVKTTTSPALKRSSGRFMDMVHPSADMKKQSGSLPVNHSGNKLQPLSKDVQPAKESEKPSSETTPATAPAQTDYEPGPPADLATTGFVSMPDDDKAAADAAPAWPDPIEVDKQEPAPAESKTDDAANQKETVSGEPAPEPTDGPFLNDQKVEKRPLGAFAGGEAASEEASPADNGLVGLPAEQTGVPPELLPEAVEAEASEVPEVVDEEAKGSSGDQAATAPLGDTSPKDETTDADDKKSAGTELGDTSSKSADNNQEAESASDNKPPVDTVNLSGQSIAPQYKPESTDNDSSQAASSVFDTKEYHQPLTPSAGQSRLKKTAGVIGLVILLVLIGAAIGYAYYIYRTGGF
ncbi:MAG TPA: hypothetical protein VFL81_03230 [Candidatus Saccharimonadales bacterium]|nr:hypothetical protein [Candidatus Saccharimonadales bacterium]